MLKRISIILLGSMLLLSACGQQGTPTMAPADVNNTAVSSAFTMVAQTQAAIPTNTPIPPTETPSPTPLPTFTLPPPPTLEQLLVPPTATQAAASGGTCNNVLNVAEAGALKSVRLENNSTGEARVGLTLTTPNAFGQCGYMVFNNIMKKGATLTLSIPVGNWYVFAWVTNKDGSSGGTPTGFFTINQGYNDLISITIKKDTIVAH